MHRFLKTAFISWVHCKLLQIYPIHKKGSPGLPSVFIYKLVVLGSVRCCVAYALVIPAGFPKVLSKTSSGKALRSLGAFSASFRSFGKISGLPM